MERGREGSASREDEDGWIASNKDDKRSEDEEDDEVMEEEKDEEEEEEENQVPTQSALRIEEMPGPSWVFLFHVGDEVRVCFSCLCNGCAWKGDEDTALAQHLKSHVYSQYGVTESGESGEEEEIEEEEDNRLFVACPIPYCNRAFSIHSMYSMESHILMHAHHASLQKKGFIALNSKKEFVSIRSCGKKEKLQSAHCGDAHVCMWDNCQMSTLDVNEFFSHVLSHMELSHSDDNICLWDECNHTFKHKSRLIPHLHHHMGMKAGACPFCGEVFSSLSKLYDHVSRRIEDDTAPNTLCKLCRKAFPNEMSLRLHVKRHIVRFRCTQCAVLFSTKHDLNRHYDGVHSQFHSQVACSFPNCTSTFTSNVKLMQHVKRHAQGNITCPHCPKQFRWTKQLTKHINLDHSGNGLAQYVCHVCNRQYGEGSSLSRHLKKNHQVSIPPGFPRFQYKKCEDGLFRLQTSRPVE